MAKKKKTLKKLSKRGYSASGVFTFALLTLFVVSSAVVFCFFVIPNLPTI